MIFVLFWAVPGAGIRGAPSFERLQRVFSRGGSMPEVPIWFEM